MFCAIDILSSHEKDNLSYFIEKYVFLHHSECKKQFLPEENWTGNRITDLVTPPFDFWFDDICCVKYVYQAKNDSYE